MKLKIKHRFSGEIIFVIETKSLKLAVEAAVNSDAALREADLGGADLGGADLGGADLREANLRRANLGGANLGWADLGGANLRRANLGGANLGGADLRWADLGGADLRWADLRWADLGGADLREADLCEADLRWANLCEADLREAMGICPPLLLLASWGDVSKELCLDLMRYDAFNHPDPKQFMIWAKGGPCPYSGTTIIRSANFTENRELIKRGFLNRKVKSAYELMQALIKEKCRTAE